MSGAFIGGDFDPRATVPRLTNYDFVRPGSALYNRLQEVIRDVNVKIAPAVIHDRFSMNDSLRALEFRGRWGTFRVSFLISDNLLSQAWSSMDRFAYELESLMSTAINNALRDLVRTEMRAEVVRVEGAQEREWRQVERDYKALADRVLELETPWWKRLNLWIQSLGRFHA